MYTPSHRHVALWKIYRTLWNRFAKLLTACTRVNPWRSSSSNSSTREVEVIVEEEVEGAAAEGDRKHFGWCCCVDSPRKSILKQHHHHQKQQMRGYFWWAALSVTGLVGCPAHRDMEVRWSGTLATNRRASERIERVTLHVWVYVLKGCLDCGLIGREHFLSWENHPSLIELNVDLCPPAQLFSVSYILLRFKLPLGIRKDGKLK